MLSKEEFVKKIKDEAKQPSRWVVITQRGRIWGTDASVSNLLSSGGKMFILDAESTRKGNFQIMDFASNMFVDLDYCYQKYQQYLD
ncbi:hypothetical protein Tsac_2835 [Thermoanaerobacterium phage THSA-485A]|uniref:hypothetical protein n=1 Tax=Thermoanaerobacterium phage THSA-485A TaxID=1126885 RepID=UPI000263F82C|nr:hypothetical protein Tsac_2835 [Thermoanaerobacterium phage THSA-485A]AFK87688.1 hypothetical protein Tsac_2835 [Thermoanaerobacterium phage THSA-485A]